MQTQTPNYAYSIRSNLFRFLFILSIIGCITGSFFIIVANIIIPFFKGELHSIHPRVQCHSASFTSLEHVIGPNLTAKFDITLILTNPNNKYNISYDFIVATLNNYDHFPKKYKSQLNLFASTRLPPFLQLNQSQDTLQFQINAVDQFVGDNTVAAAKAQGSIDFGLNLYAKYKTAIDWQIMFFHCKHLRFVFKINNATFASGTCLSNFLRVPSMPFLRCSLLWGLSCSVGAVAMEVNHKTSSSAAASKS